MTIDTQKLRETATTAVADTLWCTYDCLRVWEAWSVGTMGPDDFSMIVEDEDRLAEITDAALSPALAAIDAQAAEIEQLRSALRWTAGALQSACQSAYCSDEGDRVTIGAETRTVSQILGYADAALSGEPT